LLREGALWNTFVMAGAAERFWALTKVHLPEQHAMFESYRRVAGTAGESQTLVNIYERMGAADFSRDVLEKADGLGVVALAPCGWSDWGTPDRVLESLRGSDDFAALMNRLSNASTSDRSEQRAGRLTA
jgi:mannose-1-phosphate guanylyltransferase